MYKIYMYSKKISPSAGHGAKTQQQRQQQQQPQQQQQQQQQQQLEALQ